MADHNLVLDIKLIILLVGLCVLSSSITLFITDTIFNHTIALEFKYTKMSQRASTDEFIVNLAEICNMLNETTDKVGCVHDFFSRTVNYQPDAEFTTVQSVLNVTNCETSTEFYCAVFKAMEINCRPILLKTHVYALVDFPEGYCNLDILEMNCFYYQ